MIEVIEQCENIENISNIEAFKKLIDKYRSLTERDFEEAKIEMSISEGVPKKEHKPYFYLTMLTGFDSPRCSLCQNTNCNDCIYEIQTANGCVSGPNERSFIKIYEAETFEELIISIKERADYMESLLNL